jgi:hypothetical protein
VRWGDKYGDEYVLRLRAMVDKHLAEPHVFVCFTERPIAGIYCRALPSALPAWWAKLGLFRPGLIDGTKLYLDLDVVATGPLDVFVRRKVSDMGKLWALDDFSYSLRTPKPFIDDYTRGLLGGAGTCNSSVMCWNGDVPAQAWHSFTPEVMERLHGDQNHLTQVLYPDRLALYPPGLACSYKYHVLNGQRFGSLTVFHGTPKCHELERSEPLRQMWEAA